MRLFSRSELAINNYYMTIHLGLSHDIQSHEPIINKFNHEI